MIFSSFNVWINIFNFWWNNNISFFEPNQLMRAHLSWNMASIDLASNTQSFVTNITIQFQVLFFVLRTFAKLFRSFRNIMPCMFHTNFRSVTLNFAINTKIGILCNAIVFSKIWRNSCTIEAIEGLLLLKWFNNKIYQVTRINLVIFENYIFM